MNGTLPIALICAVAMDVPLSGCASTNLRISDPEIAWQTLNAVDLGQTVTIARRPSDYYEIGFPASEVIGRHPSESDVKGYFAASALMHFAVSSWLDRETQDSDSHLWHDVRIAWYVATIGLSAGYVVHNAADGIGLFSSPQHEALCVQGKSLAPGESCLWPK